MAVTTKISPFDELIDRGGHTPKSVVDKQLILDSVGPVQAVLDAHDGVVNVVDTTDGIIMISLEGGCTGCGSTPMTAMQIYYSLMQLDVVTVSYTHLTLPTTPYV